MITTRHEPQTTPTRADASARRRATLVACALLLAIAALLPGCARTDADRLEIVVTTNILGDLTRALAGDAASVMVLMPPGADPHQFAISAQQAARIEQAALLIHNGLGLEEGVQRHVSAAEQSGVATLSVGEQIDPIDYRATDRPDPHFWTDPARTRKAVELISSRLLELPGIDTAAVRSNTDRYLAELDALDAWMTSSFASIPPEQRRLVTNHHVFGYLAQRFGFEVIGAIVPSGTALASPSASDLADLATAVRTAGVRAVFADSSQPDRLARVLAEQAGLNVKVVSLHTESLTEPGGGAATYLEMMRTNTEAIVTGLTAP
ncbi:zinc ABC transporter substrate-binding protein [Nocardia huaxiensis]|uniref:Zinc ABC transporter substrate-binding protein n=1 Tax=Nocardia huaxiensis TaxID=2755382 RepID=A0A7D6VI61_9NOCA|nr:zinc ABC transporter substrate-binding protein AztC [Nocardia huaxiensis]QLY33477.1 zinc ABC transporter substrate-binding protein [Nocardia huaxiensis]